MYVHVFGDRSPKSSVLKYHEISFFKIFRMYNEKSLNRMDLVLNGKTEMFHLHSIHIVYVEIKLLDKGRFTQQMLHGTHTQTVDTGIDTGVLST